MPVPTLHVLTPTLRPVGGVVKVMDYATHARAAGMAVSIWCPSPWEPDLPLFRLGRLAELTPTAEVTFHEDPRLVIRASDLVFVSLPSNVEVAAAALPRGMSPERIIHIIQGVRHRNPSWAGGRPLRILTHPMARIATNEIVRASIQPWVDPRSLLEVIPIGHELGYFHRDRSGGLHDPLRVAYTTWKSDIGDRVRDRLGDDPAFTFRAVREAVDWPTLRELYHWAEVFVCSPRSEEGFYMPGLEALEAGCLIVTPDVGGNMAYCRPGENCMLVAFDDPAAYVGALRDIAAWDPDRVEAVRRAGQLATQPYDLAAERRSFGAFLERLWPRVRDFEATASGR